MGRLLIIVAATVAAFFGRLIFKSASKARKAEHFDEDNKHIRG